MYFIVVTHFSSLLLKTVDYSSSDETKLDVNDPDSSLLASIKSTTPILSGLPSSKWIYHRSNGEDGSSDRSKAYGLFSSSSEFLTPTLGHFQGPLLR
jgi:hypothetical protein